MIPNLAKRSRVLFGAVGAAFVLLSAAACSGDGGVTKAAASGASTVTLKLIAFRPERLEVKAGTNVTWRNADGTAHTVTSGQVVQEGGGVQTTPDGVFDSGELAMGTSFSFTLAKPGTYSYYCRFHPATMRGEIVVS